MAVLLSAGDHVPNIPLFEIVGSGASVSPVQIGATAGNVGTVLAELTVMVRVVVAEHCPALGVKV